MQNDREKFKEDFTRRLVRFSVDVIRFVEQLRAQPLLWAIADQLIRCATSIGANVFEAKSSSSKRDYTHFFEISLKSANETKYWLIILIEVAPQFSQTEQMLFNECEEIAKILGSSVLTLKGKR